MVAFERTRITVDQCQECRGIFLDYGELERLIDAEGGGWSGRIGPPSEEPDDARPMRVARPHDVRGSTKGRAKTIRELFGD